MKIFKYISVAMAAGFVIIILAVWLIFFRRGSQAVHTNNFVEQGSTNSDSSGDDPNSPADNNRAATIPKYDYTEAPKHIGEKVTIKGTVLKVFTSKSGVTFFDYCKKSSKCPFSAVIFASDLPKFKDVSRYARQLSITGIIRSYQNRAEMIVNDPEQIE